MKKLLLIGALCSSLFSTAQITLFEDSFETYADFAKTGVGAWTLTDVDLRPTYGFDAPTSFPGEGTAIAFIVFNSTATTPPLVADGSSNWTARTGTKAMASIAAVPNATFPNNEDWLISPSISLGSSGNTLTFWAKSCDNAYPDETFNVAVSTTDTAVGSFTNISSEIATFGTYVEYSYDLDTYQGQNIYIAIHCTSEDLFGFMVDDFKVTATALSADSFTLAGVKIYPNPAKDVLNIESSIEVLTKVSITDLNGRVVKEVSNNLSQISLGDLAKGIYMVTIESATAKKVEKLIVE
ncbi:MAG: choice-of-anchor J domain-containing protein [Bacteroidota bacterium]